MVSHVKGHIYVLHFTQSVSHARHYIGWTVEGGLERRIQEHRSGGAKASPLVRALIERGGDFHVAAVLPGDRFMERRMKNSKNGSRWCPICKGTHASQIADLLVAR